MALAPESLGIGIDRHFTAGGRDPYDTVAWERRDARISNWATGAVAFEQKAVEVPAQWSINATNILAQKYFRGTLGTPQREWTLKQVVDRVVDTITGWGVKDGYFLDSEEASAFSDELKYLIIHQRAAFNSPVWFNIGVPGVPQQGSACQPYGSLVHTPDGLIPIGRLVESGAVGAKVLDAHGVTRIVAVKHNGRKPVLRVHTRSGHQLEVTPDHLVWRCSDAHYGRFVPASDLRPGDRLAWHRVEGFGEGEITSRATAEAALLGRGPRGEGEVVPEQLFSAPLPVVAAYLGSMFQADGYVSLQGSGALVSLEVPSPALLGGVQTLLGRFGIFSRVRHNAVGRQGRKGTYRLTIRTLADRVAFASEIGFPGAEKQAELDRTLSLPGIRNGHSKQVEVASVEMLGDMDVYDIQTESGEYLSENLRVHNCFILAVEDSMDSILDWYKEEGIIFKGGSGAGVNLSRIRSSHEHLRGGGTASGPVSFMRGADASAGTIKSGGKCFKEGTLVSTPNGLVPIEQLRVGDLVLTHRGPRPVADFMPNGEKLCYRVRTTQGYEVEVTEGHKFAYWDAAEGSFEVKPIESFVPGESLYALLAPSEGGEAVALIPPQVADPPHATTTVEMRFPTELDDRLAYVLGVSYGDGELRTEYPYRLRVAFCKDAPGYISAERFSRYCEELFGERPLDLGEYAGHRSLGFTRKRLVDFLVVNGIAKGKGRALGFPSTLLRATPEVRAAFIAGYIDADGSQQKRGGWSIGSIDRAFLVQLQRLLLTLGVPSKVKVSRSARGTWRCLYRLHIVGDTFVDRLVDLIRPYSAKSQMPSERPGHADKGWGYRPSLYREVVARAGVLGEPRWVERALGSNNETSGFGAMASLTARAGTAIADYAAEVTTCVQLTLESVEPTEVANTYDIEVADVHLLCANGIYASNTRRAAKMVILNADHPDIEDFIWCKAIEERKARALRDAGFDMDLDGRDTHSIQYQNANNSVRVTDEFMQAVVEDRDWELRAVSSGEVLKTLPARDLFRQIAKAAWECADPGMQFDTTINRWHTAPSHGRINASNPCFTGDSLVHTDKGLIAFRELFARANQGETFAVYTHDATNPDEPVQRLELTRPEAYMITGLNPVVRLRFDNGMEVRCTPGHGVFTLNRGYVAAAELTPDDRVKALDLPAPAVGADWALPQSAEVEAYRRKGDHRRAVNLPEKWSPELGHLLGWLVGDGSVGANGTISGIYGTEEEQREVLPKHRELMAELNGGAAPTPSVQSNGTQQLRMTRRVLTSWFAALGLQARRGPEKRVPSSLFQAPEPVAAAFLQGLFDADGCVRRDDRKGSYVGLGSSSRELLVDVQRLLSTFGVHSRIYLIRTAGEVSGMPYVRRDGTRAVYKAHALYDLRISASSIPRFSARIGFTLPGKAEKLLKLIEERRKGFYDTDSSVRLVERIDEGWELTYNLSEPRNRSYIVNGLVVRNCSEYMHVDNSACNLASLNLLTFLEPDGTFDIEGFKAATSVLFTAQEIIVGNADYPTESIAENSRRFRQLGIGYANLGALLMAQGLPYDSEGGRAWAGAITALLTGQSYATSARTASRMGPFAGFTANREAMLGVLEMHRSAAAEIDEELAPPELLSAAQRAWDEAVAGAERYGVRNSQASVMAPTGCLVGETLVPTDRGLVRLRSLGDPEGATWQRLDARVATDEGPRAAEQFYINGVECTVRVTTTTRGHTLRGTPQHRIKVVDEQGVWVWRRLSDLKAGDVVPMAMNNLVGPPRDLVLPPLAEAYWTGEHHAAAPRFMSAELAELLGYFMGDGSLHSRGLRFCVTNSDLDVVARLEDLGKSLFNLSAKVTEKTGYREVRFDSIRLVLWWEACGFAKQPPHAEHQGKGWVAHIPDAVLHSNDSEVYGSFLRGLYEADGDASIGSPTLCNTSIQMVRDAQAVLLALGLPTTLSQSERSGSWGSNPIARLRLVNSSYNAMWLEKVGFIGDRKSSHVSLAENRQSGRHDYIPLTRELLDRVLPENGRLRRVLLMEIARGRVTRTAAQQLADHAPGPEVEHLLSFFYDRVSSAELGEGEPTYDLSVPENVTYVANGFVSHNTIALMMDCDTTGIEPDLSLVKTKKLVGGGTMSIVNQTVPRALSRLGYTDQQTAEIINYIDVHKSIVGAPDLRPEHLPVFACSMGDNVIHYRGHLQMMGAIQPFVSGAQSKTVNLPETATVEDIEQLHIEAWELGLKAVAIYRDNCKVGQPLSTTKKAVSHDAETPEEHDDELAAKVEELEKALLRQTVVVRQPIRERMPRRRRSSTFAFRVADCEGFVTVGEYDDGRPGEVFMKVAKQGSTLAGIMDAFAISVSLGLQHGVPLATYVRKYTSMRFEPAGITDDPDLRIAQSLVDYIFRRLAVDYMTLEERAELGVLTSDERIQPTLPGVEEAVTPSLPVVEVAAVAAADAPYCMQCGVQMQRSGSCHACPSCGTTSGCS